jgi:hypothetical protein
MREDKGSWFDDPEWENLRREVHNRPVLNRRAKMKSPSTVKESEGEAKKIKLSLNLTLPDIKLPKLSKLPGYTLLTKAIARGRTVKFTRKRLIIGGVACLMLIGSIGILKAVVGKDAAVTTGVLGEAAKEPEFKTVLPEGNAEATSSKKIAYDPKRKVASFTDTINGVDITVSQQPLPESFESDPSGQLKKVAENFNAKKEIKAGGLTAYIGTSAKGPQSVVFVRGDLLIFLFSQREIPDQIWGTYILSLE